MIAWRWLLSWSTSTLIIASSLVPVRKKDKRWRNLPWTTINPRFKQIIVPHFYHCSQSDLFVCSILLYFALVFWKFCFSMKASNCKCSYKPFLSSLTTVSYACSEILLCIVAWCLWNNKYITTTTIVMIRRSEQPIYMARCQKLSVPAAYMTT